jgi:hypothetical protein
MGSVKPVLDGKNVCLGHLLKTARGWRAFDRQDAELGTFESEDAAAAALTKQQTR